MARDINLLAKELVDLLLVDAKEPRQDKAGGIGKQHSGNVAELLARNDDQQAKQTGNALRNRADMKQRRERAAKSGTQAGRHKRTNERQRNSIHQRLAHTQDSNGNGLCDVLLELSVLGLKVQRQTGTDLAAASHHKDGKQVIDTLGSAVGIVEHSVDRRERLMQADGHQRQEACRQDIAAQDAQLLEDKGQNAKDGSRQPWQKMRQR